MHAAGTNEPVGSRYNIEFGDWLAKHHFDDIEKGDRHRLFEVTANRADIEKWRAEELPANQRLRINHPNTVLRKWRAATQPKAATAKRPSPTRVARTSPSWSANCGRHRRP